MQKVENDPQLPSLHACKGSNCNCIACINRSCGLLHVPGESILGFYGLRETERQRHFVAEWSVVVLKE